MTSLEFTGKFAKVNERSNLVYILTEEEYKRVLHVLDSNEAVKDCKGKPLWAANGIYFLQCNLSKYDKLAQSLKPRVNNCLGRNEKVKSVIKIYEYTPIGDGAKEQAVSIEFVSARIVN